MFNVYLNPDQDDRIFEFLLSSMAALQADDMRVSTSG